MSVSPPSNRPRGMWGLADQGVVSAGNFATNIIAARYLTIHEFGYFALIFDILLLLNSLTAATVCYPLSIKGSGTNELRTRRYVTASIVLTAAWVVPLGALCMLATALITHNAGAGACAALALVGWQLQETSRRGLMAQLRFQQAIWGDAIGYPGQALVMLILGEMHLLTVGTALLAVGITSLAAFVLQWIQIGIVQIRTRRILQTGRTFWLAGRWMLLTNIASIPTVQAISWVLAVFAGVTVVAEYQAIVNLLRVANPVITGISGIIVPSAARARRESGMSSAWHTTIHHALQGAVLLAPYFFILLVFPRQVLALVYGHMSPFVNDAGPLRLYVAATVIFFLAQVILTFMSAVEESRAVFWAQCYSTAATLLISLPLTARYGLYGVVAGVAVSILVRFIAAAFSLRLLTWSVPTVDTPMPALLSSSGVPTAV